MLKLATGTARSLHTTACARTEAAEALLTEKSVVKPFGSSRFTSKYGRRSVAPGTASTVQRTAAAGAAAARRTASAAPPARIEIRRMSRLLSIACFQWTDAVTDSTLRAGPAAGAAGRLLDSRPMAIEDP